MLKGLSLKAEVIKLILPELGNLKSEIVNQQSEIINPSPPSPLYFLHYLYSA